MWVEVAERSTHNHLVARFQREDVRRSDTWVHIHETALVGLEWRCGDTNGKHKYITLGRIVGHRVGTDGILGVLTLQGEQAELLPAGQIFVANQRLVEVLIVVDAVELWNLNLCV